MRRRGFTLLETLVTLVVLGAAAAVVAPRIAEETGSGRSRRAVVEVVSALRLERMEALRTMTAREARVESDGRGAVRMESGAGVREWASAGLMVEASASAERGAAGGAIGARVVFEASGRAHGGPWRLRELRAGRVWVVGFDPVSGAPAVEQGTE